MSFNINLSVGTAGSFMGMEISPARSHVHPPARSPVAAQPLALQRSLFPLLMVACALLAAPAAQAGIIYHPASMVDHGTYVTDTVNQRDWYKFNNAATTVGLSYEASVAQFSPQGWTVAGLNDVRSLQTQFGWVADSFDFSGDNFGLTNAMASYLGVTGVDEFHPVSSPNLVTTTYKINAMTWNGFCATGFSACDQDTTLNEYKTLANHTNNAFSFIGDYISGQDGSQYGEASDPTIGTWLTRASVQTDDGCVRVAATAPCSNNVPEPTSVALVGLGLLGLITQRRRQRG